MFGLGAYFLVLSLAVVDAWLLARRPITEPLLRAAGWALALLGISTLLALGFHGASPGPVIGPGGYLSAAGRAVLEMNFARPVPYILTISVTLAGLLLLHRLFVVPLGILFNVVPLAGVLHLKRQVRGIQPAASAKTVKKSRDNDVDDDLPEADGNTADAGVENDAAEPEVRIRKRVKDSADAAEHESAEEELAAGNRRRNDR